MTERPEISDIDDWVLPEAITSTFAAASVEGALETIVDLATRVIDGCTGAGVMSVTADGIATAAASSSLVVLVDQFQIDADDGPCVEAARRATTIYAHDLLDDGRWPTFAPAAVEAGIRTVLSCSLPADGSMVLNLYAPLPAAFGATDRAQASLFAALARIALASAQERTDSNLRTDNLIIALRTRELIGQAQGILIERERITADQAFDVLRRASQHMNIKLREVAETLIETGETPDTGPQDRD
ncbi:MAG TPA: GAF and ANTAR domain-containing protein [Gaiellaceae bacterium]|nr:GAF and ANTAR domain-containing protein [Gaiellaceae bacterium]